MRVAVLGGNGIEGRAAYAYWRGLGHEVVLHDANAEAEVPAGAEAVLGPDYLDRLGGYDLIVRSPGVKPWVVAEKLVAAGLQTPVTSGTREFFAQCPAPIIGVTGTKGKGTTSSLIVKILEAAGHKVWLGGNIGRPAVEFLPDVQVEDLVVLELSSFQLMDLEQSPSVAVCLMIVPEHMDWHRSFEEYVEAKGAIFRYQEPKDRAVYHAHNDASRRLAAASAGTRVPYLAAPGAEVKAGRIVVGETDICGTDEVGLVGPHNLENICAAVTATWELVGHNVAPVVAAVKAFTGLEHRLELVRELDGVRYYDDSFATTPETAMAAIASFAEPKVLILGGSDKRSEYGELAKAVQAGKVRQAILIGEMADKIEGELRAVGFEDIVKGAVTMPEMVAAARKAAQPGDVVLLSPACASFGLFRNYKDRGDQYQAAVRAL